MSPAQEREGSRQNLRSIAARRTLKGYEIMNMMRKEQVKKVRRGAVIKWVNFLAEIFGLTA